MELEVERVNLIVLHHIVLQQLNLHCPVLLVLLLTLHSFVALCFA